MAREEKSKPCYAKDWLEIVRTHYFAPITESDLKYIPLWYDVSRFDHDA